MHRCDLRQISSYHLQIREGGGCLSVFGLPFFAAGVFLTLAGWKIIPMENAAEVPDWSWPLLVAMGLVFMGVGGWLVFGRTWVDIHPGFGRVMKRRGLWVPMQSELYPLAEYNNVCVRLEAGDSDTSDRYPVYLESTASGRKLLLVSSAQYAESYRRAEQIAKFLRFPLEDAATEHARTIPAAATRIGAAKTGMRESNKEETAPRPLLMRSRVEESDGEVRITIPARGFEFSRLVSLAVSVCIMVYLVPRVVSFFRRTQTPEHIERIFLAVAVIFFLVLPVIAVLKAVIRAARARTLVIAGAGGITIEYQDAWAVRKTVISSGDILDIDYGTAASVLSSATDSSMERLRRYHGPEVSVPDFISRQTGWYGMLNRFAKSKGVVVKSKKGLFDFGASLPDDEVFYLYSLIKRAI